MLSATLLGEAVGWSMIAVTVAVILCVAGAKRFAQPGPVRAPLPQPDRAANSAASSG
jgi:hypothetical protein